MKKLNAHGPDILGNLPLVRGLPPSLCKEAVEEKGNVLIDARMMLAFGGGHIQGAFSIGGSPMLSIWSGWLLDSNNPILFFLKSYENLNKSVRLFLRTGCTNFVGYLVGGMKAWDNAGLPLDEIGQMTVHEIKARVKQLQLLNVGSPDEWRNGHIPHARHMFLGELREKLDVLDKGQPTAVYCDSGYRASIATSVLQKEGFSCVCNVPGGWQAWQKAGFAVEEDKRKENHD